MEDGEAAMTPAADPPPPAELLPGELPEHVLPRPRPAVRRLVLAAAAALMALSLVTTALSPALAARDPLLLLALESPFRNMLLASRVAVAPFLAVVTARRLLGATVYFFIGRWYGDAAVLWLERRAGPQGRTVRRVERAVRAGAYPLVFVAPTAVVCTVAGAMGLRPWVFVAVAGAGSLTVGAAVRLAGEALHEPIARVVGAFERHMVAATLAAAGLVALGAARGWHLRRRARRA